MTHEDYKELLALEALGGALGEAKGRALETHLASCAECRGELAEMRDTAATLVYTLPPAAPPAELRARILANIRALSNDAPRSDTAQNDVQGNADADAAHMPERTQAPTPEHADDSLSAQPASTVLPFTRPREGVTVATAGRKRAWKYGALAASLVAATLLVSLVVLWQRNQAMRTELARLSARTNDAEARIDRTEQELAREREVQEIFNAPDGRLTTLTGTAAAPGARARLAYDRQTGRAIMLAHGLPPAPAGKAYQLWFIAGGKPLPGGVFTTDTEGRAVLRDRMPPEGRAAPIFAVTLEPSAGVAAPTGDKYLLGRDAG